MDEHELRRLAEDDAERERAERMRLEGELQEAVTAKEQAETRLEEEIQARERAEQMLEAERELREQYERDMEKNHRKMMDKEISAVRSEIKDVRSEMRTKGNAASTVPPMPQEPVAYKVDIHRGSSGLMESFTMKPMG